MSVTEFRERIERGPLDATVLALLPRRISDLELRIAGTPLEGLIAQLYRELGQRGLRFRPKCYLADEWGCPPGVPFVGIPFYLADPQLARIEGELTGIEAETEVETLMYLRHESGHAFNYAYRLYLDGEWTRTFGSFRRPYPEEYRPEPFSDRYVRHIPGWDGAAPPAGGFFGEPVEGLRATLAEWYSHLDQRGRRSLGLPRLLNTDLRRLFPSARGVSAESFMIAYRSRMLYEVNYWTGMDLDRLGELIDALIERIHALGLRVGAGQESRTLIGVVALLTTLVMNHHYTNQFVRR